MNIKAMKLLDAVVGKLAVLLISSPLEISLPPKCITSLLLIRPGGIGDAVLLAPTILAIKKEIPNVYITVLAEQRNAPVFSLINGVNKVLCYDKPSDLFQVMRSKYSCVIDSEQSHYLSAVVARFVAARVKIGFDTNERSKMFTHTISYSHDDYEAFSFARLLEPLEIDGSAISMKIPFLSLPVPVFKKAEIFLKKLQNLPFVTIFPGASIAERRWGAVSYREVAQRLLILGLKIVVVGGKEDWQEGEIITDGEIGVNLVGMTSLSETAAVIQKSSLLISGDSGILHIAVGFGVPTVSLFGAGRSKKWAPQGLHNTLINKELSCSPCTTFGTTPPCQIDAKCMRDITVEEVVKAVTHLLNRI